VAEASVLVDYRDSQDRLIRRSRQEVCGLVETSAPTDRHARPPVLDRHPPGRVAVTAAVGPSAVTVTSGQCLPAPLLTLGQERLRIRIGMRSESCPLGRENLDLRALTKCGQRKRASCSRSRPTEQGCDYSLLSGTVVGAEDGAPAPPIGRRRHTQPRLCRVLRVLLSWTDAASRIDAAATAAPASLDLNKRLFGRMRRSALVITGNSGAGKTRLWSRLTSRQRPDEMSLTRDDGYMVSPNNRSLALVTIPGQPVRPRYTAFEMLFGPDKQVDGVIFVASNGYDHVWPAHSELFGRNLQSNQSYDLPSLRLRNKLYEAENFRDVCHQIIRKHYAAAEPLRPRWLLVLVNKADIYWDERADAENYYLPGCGSDFDQKVTEMRTMIGMAAINYYVLPVATQVAAYDFRSSLGPIRKAAALNQAQSVASLESVVEMLGSLND
jgi:hypothetical protein